MSEIKRNKKRTFANLKLKIESTRAEAEIALLTSLGERKSIKKEQQLLLPIKTRIAWTGKGRLQELADILYKKKFIKTKKAFLKFFEKSSTIAKVRWNPEKRYHLAYLLYFLNREKYFIVKGNKGYFNYAEHHFTDFNAEPFKKNSLKKLSSRVVLDKERFCFIHNEIGEIILKITQG